jgi:hypothetical protein
VVAAPASQRLCGHHDAGADPAIQARPQSSAVARRTLMRPSAITSADPATACATAAADRSIARMWPVVSRSATARAAAPGPQPISSTRVSGRSGSASTAAASRAERATP